MKLKVGDKVTMNFPGHALHGQPFEVVKVNGRHQFVIARVLERFGDYRAGEDLHLAGTLLAALEPLEKGAV